MVHLALPQITMSSQLTSLVPLFDGSGYITWAKAIKAFLMSQGLWGFVSGTFIELPYPWAKDSKGKLKDPGTEQLKKYCEEHDPWQQCQDMCLGSIMLCL